MKSVPKPGFRPELWVFFVLLILCPLNAHAHDPGLSSATVTVEREQIDVILGFAKKDAESLVVADRTRPQGERPPLAITAELHPTTNTQTRPSSGKDASQFRDENPAKRTDI